MASHTSRSKEASHGLVMQIERSGSESRGAGLLFGETWRCGGCGRVFDDCTSCVAHESQCGGHLDRC